MLSQIDFLISLKTFSSKISVIPTFQIEFQAKTEDSEKMLTESLRLASFTRQVSFQFEFFLCSPQYKMSTAYVIRLEVSSVIE